MVDVGQPRQVGLRGATVTRHKYQHVGSPPVAAIADDALPIMCGRGFGFPKPHCRSISDRLSLPFRSPVKAIARRTRGGTILTANQSQLAIEAELLPSELSDCRGPLRRSVLVVNYSFQSRRAIARSPLCFNR